MKKKIFFILSTNEYSGAEAVNINIINSLKEKYDFYWVCRKGPICDYLKDNNIKWIEITKNSRKEIKRIITENKPDLLHAVNYRMSTICALSGCNIPIICHLHNNAPWIKRFNKNSISFLFAGIKAKKILIVSESIKKEYLFSKFIKNKFEIIGNPISRENILSKVNNDNIEKKYDICCVARIEEPKNPKLFVDIINEIYYKKKRKIKAVWVGDGKLKETIINYAKEKKVSDLIDFVGFKKNPYNIMNKSKIFLLTSKWEGFGLVAFEALTLGLPCVVSNVGGLPDIIDESCGKLCNNVSTKDYINEIEKLLTDKNYYKAKHISSNTKSLMLENKKEYMKKIEQLYMKV